MSKIINHPWFLVQPLPNNVFAIMEPHHFKEVISYLIIGKMSALLFDTGAGIANIAEIVKMLWDGCIIPDELFIYDFDGIKIIAP
ncbi:MAG: hypothetical protein FWC32_02735 [Firmicutes bacterium]|nr:hypothetical protein [Bacillota bacterium]